jgi:hypothetical protein
MQAAEKDLTDLVNHLTNQEIEGAWKILCTNTLLRAVTAIRSCVQTSKESVRQMHAARHWVFSDEGLITFAETCESIGVDPSKARSLIVSGADDGTIKTLTIPPNLFGRQRNAKLPVNGPEDQADYGVGSCVGVCTEDL